MRIKYFLFICLFLCFVSSPAFADDLTPDNPPASTSSYTLEDIWQRLNSGTPGSPTAFSEPTAPPSAAGTGHDLNEVMAQAPAKDANGAVAADVVNGKVFWGLTAGEWGVRTGTRRPAPVARMGDPSSAGVDWPDPRFTVNGDGTVTDNLTGVIWLQDTDCIGEKAWTDVDTPAKIMAIINTGGCTNYTAGTYTDWRLPTLKEATVLIHYGFRSPAMTDTSGSNQWTTNGDPFLDLDTTYCTWTSTTTGTGAWVVDFDDGLVKLAPKTDTFYPVPVR